MIFINNIINSMGTECTICEKVSLNTDSKQLSAIFLSDRKAGSYLNFSYQAKKAFCETIRDKQFQLLTQNKLIPNQQQKTKAILYFPQKYIYQGSILDDLPHGKGRLNLIQNAIIEGDFSNGKMNGQCVIQYRSEIWIKGLWVNGFPTQVQFKKQAGKYEIIFQDHTLTKGRVKFPNKSQYNGQFEYDAREKIVIIKGKGTLKYSNGQILQGQFVNGFLQGQGVYYSVKQKYRYYGAFKRGLFNGQGTFDFGEKGTLKIGWKDNKPEGKGQFIINEKTLDVIYEKGLRKQAKTSNIYQ